jgi:hypothetical protein
VLEVITYEPLMDLGREYVRVGITIRNRGDIPVRIVGAEVPCNCAVPWGLPLRLEPRGVGIVQISITLEKGVLEDLPLTLLTTADDQEAIPMQLRWRGEGSRGSAPSG